MQVKSEGGSCWKTRLRVLLVAQSPTTATSPTLITTRPIPTFENMAEAWHSRTCSDGIMLRDVLSTGGNAQHPALRRTRALRATASSPVSRGVYTKPRNSNGL